MPGIHSSYEQNAAAKHTVSTQTYPYIGYTFIYSYTYCTPCTGRLDF